MSSNSANSSDGLCPSCGSPLDLSILGGSCPACLLGGVLSAEVAEQQQRQETPDIEGYEIIEEIGHGGMGVVYRARQETPQRDVALKIVSPFSLRAAEARARFLLEIEAMAAVEHPGLLPLYDAGEDRHGRPWLSMQLAHEKTLAHRVANYREDWRAICQLLISLCEAIHFAHERGILHRDLKPANILFDNDNHPLVADFGLAKWTDEDTSFTHSSILLGSPAYLAPETAREGSKVTTTVSDVYGLGAILYELLVGAKPYEGNQPAEILTQILDHSPSPPRQRLKKVPRDLEVIVMQAMARSPEKRYRSAAAFAEDLERWLDGKPILARPVSPLEKVIIWARRNPALATLTVLFFSSLITAGVLLWKSNQELKASLDDVESRVEFMTRELPASLAPLGRLDLLDEVFLNVSEHYDNQKSEDTEGLARHADFLTQWAQILKDRGQTEEMIKRLELALAKAKAASEKGHPSPAVSRARLAAGWRLGEVLLYSGESHNDVQSENLRKARTVLEATSQFSKAVTHDDLQYQALQAQLAVELMILETNGKNLDKAIRHGEEAKKMWARVRPKLERAKQSAHNQQAIKASTDVDYFLLKAHHLAGNTEAESQALADWVEARRTTAELFPENLQFVHAYATARKSQVSRGAVAPAEAVKILLAVDEDFTFLLSRDSSNVRWRTEGVTVARLLADNYRTLGETDNLNKWMDIMSQRLLPLYKFRSTSYLKVLVIRREEAARCGEFFLPSDWSKALSHFNGSVQTQIKIAETSNSPEEKARLQRMKNRMKPMLIKRDGENSYQEWLDSL